MPCANVPTDSVDLISCDFTSPTSAACTVEELNWKALPTFSSINGVKPCVKKAGQKIRKVTKMKIPGHSKYQMVAGFKWTTINFDDQLDNR